MRRRLTDTDIWGKPWFLDASPEAKCFWMLAKDTCDAAGVLDVSPRIIAAKINGDVDWPGEIERLFLSGPDPKIARIPDTSPEKWFLRGFMKFTYRDSRTPGGSILSHSNPAHRSVFESIAHNNLDGWFSDCIPPIVARISNQPAPPSGLKAPTKPVVSGEDQPPTERDAGREQPALDDLKQPGPEGIKTKAKSKTKALPEEAAEIVALWKAFISLHKAALSRTDASFAQGAKNLVKCHSEAGIAWETLKRCAERYLAEVESDRRFGFVFSFGNFYGRDAHYDGYLADDWTMPVPQKSTGQIHEIPSVDDRWKDIEPDDGVGLADLLADMKAQQEAEQS